MLFRSDSTLGEILAEPLAVEMFNQMAPGMLENPMLAMAHQMTMAELCAQAAEAKPLYGAVIGALNQQEIADANAKSKKMQ